MCRLASGHATSSTNPQLQFQHQPTDNALDKLAGALSSEAPCSARTLCTSAFAAAFVCGWGEVLARAVLDRWVGDVVGRSKYGRMV